MNIDTKICFEQECKRKVKYICSCTSLHTYSCRKHFEKHYKESINHIYDSFFLKPYENTKDEILKLLAQEKLEKLMLKKSFADSLNHIIKTSKRIIKESLTKISFDTSIICNWMEKISNTDKVSKTEKDPILKQLSLQPQFATKAIEEMLPVESEIESMNILLCLRDEIETIHQRFIQDKMKYYQEKEWSIRICQNIRKYEEFHTLNIKRKWEEIKESISYIDATKMSGVRKYLIEIQDYLNKYLSPSAQISLDKKINIQAETKENDSDYESSPKLYDSLYRAELAIEAKPYGQKGKKTLTATLSLNEPFEEVIPQTPQVFQVPQASQASQASQISQVYQVYQNYELRNDFFGLEDPHDSQDLQDFLDPEDPHDSQDPQDFLYPQNFLDPQDFLSHEDPHDSQNSQVFQDPQDPHDSQNSQDPQDPQDPHDIIKLYNIKKVGNRTELIISHSEGLTYRKILNTPEPLGDFTCITDLPNNELFCYGSQSRSGITLIIDKNYEIRVLPSGKPCCWSSAIYFNNNVYCFGGSYFGGSYKDQYLDLSMKFDLHENQWNELVQMPIYDKNCSSVIFNGNILISGYRNKNLLRYSLEANKFSTISYDFAEWKRKILINAEKLYLIECGKGLVYESEDENNWKKISKSKISLDSSRQLYCLYYKGCIYIAEEILNYNFNLKKKAWTIEFKY